MSTSEAEIKAWKDNMVFDANKDILLWQDFHHHHHHWMRRTLIMRALCEGKSLLQRRRRRRRKEQGREEAHTHEREEEEEGRENYHLSPLIALNPPSGEKLLMIESKPLVLSSANWSLREQEEKEKKKGRKRWRNEYTTASRKREWKRVGYKLCG